MEDFKVPCEEISENGVSGLPAKQSGWSRVKAFLFQEIKVELTPKQQEFENKLNDFLFQEITFKQVRDFLFQEIKFGK